MALASWTRSARPAELRPNGPSTDSARQTVPTSAAFSASSGSDPRTSAPSLQAADPGSVLQAPVTGTPVLPGCGRDVEQTVRWPDKVWPWPECLLADSGRS